MQLLLASGGEIQSSKQAVQGLGAVGDRDGGGGAAAATEVAVGYGCVIVAAALFLNHSL